METQKYNHGEAFMWMYYSNKDGSAGYWIYNSRDGVTPFNCRINDTELQHQHWKSDLCQPVYKPKEGDLVWRTWTLDECEAHYRKLIESRQEFKERFESPEEIETFILGQRKDAEQMKHPALTRVNSVGEYILVE